MQCPQCNADTYVRESRAWGRTLRRRRVCLQDNAHRVTTIELPIPSHMQRSWIRRRMALLLLLLGADNVLTEKLAWVLENKE